MKTTTLVFAFTAALATTAACKKKDSDKKSDPPGDTKGTVQAKPEEAKPADPPPADPKPAEVKLVETDLSAWGPAWAGYVAMAPEGAKVELDDPSRQLHVDDMDYISVSEAPGWDDANSQKSLSSDPDNSEIKETPNEVHYLRNPPLGKQWNFDTKFDFGGTPWSCAGGTFTSAEMEAKLTAICKSIHKK